MSTQFTGRENHIWRIGENRKISDFYYDADERARILDVTGRQGFLDNCEVRFKRQVSAKAVRSQRAPEKELGDVRKEPASEKKMVEEKADREEILKGNETVLLVDDEEMILEVGLKMLITLGYKVLTARSGREAAELYRENRKKIDLVILDMIMPGVGGKETFEELKKIDPDVRVLLSSGYSIDSRAKPILDCGCKDFIRKPFDLSAFSSKLREVLER